MSKPALIVLAAGMGSRYGGLKQMDSFGPHGENIIDYSIYDAIQAGFDAVVFIIREQFQEQFQEFFSGKFDHRLKVHYVTQELDDLPAGYVVPEGREKPWGTAHAVLMAREIIDMPFGVINADDFYGRDAFKKLADALNAMEVTGEYCVIGYPLKNTLSEHGAVNRGVCKVTDQGFLKEIVEVRKIKRNPTGEIEYPRENGSHGTLEEQTLVSMNMWGFLPDYFPIAEKQFRQFLEVSSEIQNAEYYIPTLVDHLINTGEKRVRVIPSDSQWFGVTYKEDKPAVKSKLQALINSNVYPRRVWEE
jgi:dTDP-glucose pyrophosphorylase